MAFVETANALLSGFDSAFSKTCREEDRRWREEDMEYRAFEKQMYTRDMQWRYEYDTNKLRMGRKRCNNVCILTTVSSSLSSSSSSSLSSSSLSPSLHLFLNTLQTQTQTHREEQRRHRLEDLEQRALENARHLWLRYVEVCKSVPVRLVDSNCDIYSFTCTQQQNKYQRPTAFITVILVVLSIR